MNTGAGALLRLALRLDRVRLPVWIVTLAILPLATAAQYQKLYPDEASLHAVKGVLETPALIAIGGHLFGESIGALTAWKIGATEFILAALMSLMTVVRHTRAEEESGRLELVGATVVGRYAPMTAALGTAGLANLAAGVLIALGLIGVGEPATGSVAFGLATALFGMMFAFVAAVTAQLTESARTATAMAAAVLGASYLLRAIGDTGPSWVSWLSPMGWVINLRAYAGERWWVLGIALVLIVVLGGLAYTLRARRDVGAGLVPDRPAPGVASASLRSPLALAWRLHRGLFIGWIIAYAIAGPVLGGVTSAFTKGFEANQQLQDFLSKLGGGEALVEAYLTAAIGIMGLVAAAYTVQATMRLRAEESGGRVEPLLATRVGRNQWAASHLTFALLGTTLILAVGGAGAGLAYGIQIHDVGGQVGRLALAALVQAPAAWVLAGVGTALFGLAPRLAQLTWAGLIACVALLELGLFLGLSQWVIDVSPFAHVPKLPSSAFSGTPLVWLTAIAAVLLTAGLTGFRRRDVG